MDDRLARAEGDKEMRQIALHTAVAANEITTVYDAGPPVAAEPREQQAVNLVAVWISDWKPKRRKHQLRRVSGCPNCPTIPSAEFGSRDPPISNIDILSSRSAP